MKVKLRILKKGNEYHVQRCYFGVWLTLTKGKSEYWAKKDLEDTVRSLEKLAAERKISKITEVVEVRDVEL